MVFKKNKLAFCISQAMLTGAFAIGTMSQMAYAQTTNADTGAAPVAAPAAQEDSSIVKVVITAQNRSQQLQDVPISLQVINNEQITKLAANNMADLNGYIPGLVVDNQQPTQPNYTIRGVGSGDGFVGTEGPVGIYVDGVYAGKTGGALMNFNDIERVEVLKGPQGTLFGRNSAAGAISIVTKEPSNEFENDYNARVGEYGEKYIDTILNVPLSDTVAARFSYVDHRSNGWLTDAATGDSLNGQGDWGTRATLRWNAPEHTKVIFSWEHESLNQQARPDIGLIPASLQVPTVAYPANPATYLNPISAPAYNGLGDNVERRLYNGATLRIEHPMEWATFNSTTAYRHFNSENITNNTGTDMVNSYIDTGNVETNTTWQQEFRLSGKNDTVDWLVGASLYHEKAYQQSQVITNTDTLDSIFTHAQIPGAPVGQLVGPIYTQLNQGSAGLGLYGIPGFPMQVFGNSWQENMDNYMTSDSHAFYGDAIWHLTSKLNLTTGVRFSHDSKDFSWYNPPRTAPGVDALMANLLPALQAANLISAPQAGQLQYLLGTNIEYNVPGATNAPYAVSHSWSDTSPRVVLDYKFTPDLMAFGSVTKGYQSGGFNAQEVNSIFSPETIRSYEIGLKSYFPEQHLVVNASAFFYKFDNFQSLNFVNSNSTIPQYNTTTSNQTAQGADVDTQWKVTRNLRLYAVAEYINQVYGNNTMLNGVNLSNQPFQTPLWSGAGGLDYVQRDMWGGSIDYTLQQAYTSPTRCNSESQGQGNCLVTPTFRLGVATQHTDGRINWDAGDHKWGMGLYVTNLLNKRYVNGVDPTTTSALGTSAAQISPPRIIGMQFHYSL